MAIIRQAVEVDEPELLDLLIEMHREGLWAKFPYDQKKIERAIQYGTCRRGGVIGVIDAPDMPGRIAASMGLLVDEWWWSKACFLQHRWLFVRRDYRFGRDYAADLMRWAEECRQVMQRGIEYPFLFETSFFEDDERRLPIKERWWRRWGRKIGSTYVSGF